MCDKESDKAESDNVNKKEEIPYWPPPPSLPLSLLPLYLLSLSPFLLPQWSYRCHFPFPNTRQGS